MAFHPRSFHQQTRNPRIAYKAVAFYAAILTLGLCTATLGNDFSEWDYFRNVYLDASSSGANITDTLVGFPLLVRLDATSINFSSAKSNGEDLRFADSSGTAVPYQIESWNSASETGAAWVLLDSVYGSVDSQYIVMYWGNESATDNSSPQQVFDTANGFAGVWHFHDDLLDATYNDNDVATNNGTIDTIGLIGDAQYYDGSSDLQIPDDPSLDNTQTITFSAWAHATTLDGQPRGIMSKRTNSNNNQSWSMFMWGGNTVNIDLDGSGDRFDSDTVFATDRWYHIAAVYDGALTSTSRGRVYVNGSLDKVASETSTSLPDYNSTTVFGKLNVGYAYSYYGIIDEGRVERVARSADWVKLCYETQKENVTAIEFGELDSVVFEYRTWDGGGADNAWNNPDNWYGDAVPDTTDRVKFDITSSKDCILDGSAAVKTITLTSAYAGAFSFAGETLTVIGSAEFSSGGDISPGTGALKISGSQSLSPPATDTLPDLIIESSGTVLIKNNNMVAGNLILNSGTLDLGEGLDHEVQNISGAGALDFSSSKVTASGAAIDFSGLSALISGSGQLTLAGQATQTLTPHAGFSLPAIVHEGTDTLRLSTNDLAAVSLSLESGTLDFNGRDIQTTGNFTLNNGTSASMTGLAGRTLTIGGSAAFIGQQSDNVSLNTATDHFLNVSGSLTAVFCDIGHSDASGSAASGLASTSTDYSNNVNWDFDSEDYAHWSAMRQVFFNTSSSGAGISSDVNNFPLLLRLTSSSMDFASSAGDGGDLRFSQPNGAHLLYEIESWDSADGRADVWVKVPIVEGDKKTQRILMHWNNDTASSRSNPSAVFQSSEGFGAVWHLNADSLDATTNSNDATNFNSMSADAPGIAARGRSLSGGDNELLVADNSSLEGGSEMTFSTWVYPTTLSGSPDGIISKRVSSGSNQAYSLFFYTGNKLFVDIPASGDRFNTDDAFTTDTWWHIAVRYDGSRPSASRVEVYVNGSLAKTGASSVSAIPNTSANVHLGSLNTSYGQGFRGTMDEVRIEQAARSSDWIKLCYETQRPNAVAVNFFRPIVTGPDEVPEPSAWQNSADSVIILYELRDPTDASVDVSAQYRLSSSPGWASINDAAGDLGVSIDTGTAPDKRVAWCVSSELTDTAEGLYEIRIIADDGSYQDTASSSAFLIDTRPPSGLAAFAPSGSTSTSLSFSWTPASENYFSHYELWYDTSRAAVLARTGDEWDPDNDGALGNVSTSTTTITGLSLGTRYYAKIWAVDSMGNETTIDDTAASTIHQAAPSWSKSTVGTVLGAAVGEAVLYMSSSLQRLFCLNAADGGTRWNYKVPDGYGDPGRPVNAYIQGKSCVLFATDSRVLGREDKTTWSDLLFDVDVGSTPGVPYPVPDDTTFFVATADSLALRGFGDGFPKTGWPVHVASISLAADPVVFSDNVIAATTSGVVYKYDMDGTQLGSYNAGASIEQPLSVDSTVLFITPTSNELHAVNISDMSAKWASPVALASGNTGPAFSPLVGLGSPSGVVYVAAGKVVQKVADGGATGSVEWSFTAQDTVRGGPIEVSNTVYFGADNGYYYAVGATDSSSVTNWPYTLSSGAAEIGPWVDAISSKVVFATVDGDVDAFELE